MKVNQLTGPQSTINCFLKTGQQISKYRKLILQKKAATGLLMKQQDP